MLSENQSVPLDIEILDEESNSVTLKQYLGNYLVIYFYPRDNTPGCTTEACDFRDANQLLQRMGVTVLGVSKDSVKSHLNFKKKHKLNFPLLSDPDHKLMEAFGAWGKKKMMGREYMGIIRSTFIIDPKGKVIKVWPKVRVKGHSQQVLDYLEKMEIA